MSLPDVEPSDVRNEMRGRGEGLEKMVPAAICDYWGVENTRVRRVHPGWGDLSAGFQVAEGVEVGEAVV
jgi:hypothetical protein